MSTRKKETKISSFLQRQLKSSSEKFVSMLERGIQDLSLAIRAGFCTTKNKRVYS